MVIYKDNDIIIGKKDFSIPVQKDKTLDKSFMEILEEETGCPVFLVHRLDRVVGGVMVFARNKKSAQCLTEQIMNHTFKKSYLAVCEGKCKDSGHLIDYMIKNQSLNISKIVHQNNRNAKKAELTYEKLKEITYENKTLNLIRINLLTGRHHQIRLQMSNINNPLYGDTKYNSDYKRKRGYTIGLWSESLSFIHPTTKEQLTFTIEPENILPFNLF